MALKEVRIRQGVTMGIEKKECTAFLGIPYAKPPVGALRFCAPQKPEPWEGTYRADHFPATCWQELSEPGSFYDKEFYAAPDFKTERSEDSLYLNIWTPAEQAGEKLPVALWIHGGAFMHGFGHEQEFDGEAFCRNGVIFVSFNYRLGVFGFMAHPWLSAESSDHTSGNYGCLDQVAALEWVRENIGAFGGDPDNITLFGQSAGAMSTQTLISSPLTGNTVAKAIFQSGGGCKTGFHQNLTLKRAEEIGKLFTDYAGYTSLEALRAADAEVLCRQMFDFIKSHPECPLMLGPNVDGVLLTANCDESLKQKKIKPIPYMLGSTLDDLAVDASPSPEGPRGHLYYGCIKWSQTLEELGLAPSYVYDFRRRLPGDDAGAFHSSELWFVFGTIDRCWRPLTQADRALSDRMVSCWTNFMKYGNPNGTADAVQSWRPCTKEDPYVEEFDI